MLGKRWGAPKSPGHLRAEVNPKTNSHESQTLIKIQHESAPKVPKESRTVKSFFWPNVQKNRP